MRTQTILDAQIHLLEDQLETLRNSLVDSNPDALQFASAKFQHLIVELLQMVKEAKRSSMGTTIDMQRIASLASEMATFRENLMRRSAYIDSALSVLIPASTDKSTYAGIGVYGSSARRSGSFNAFSA